MLNRIDLKLLHAFVTVAREGSVSRAANILCLTQPAVSLQLRKLAQETGLDLFTRTRNGLDLTPDGRSMFAKAERVLSALDEFGVTARRLTNTVHGRLRVGTVIDPGFIRLGAFLQELLQTAPQLQTELVHGISGEVLQRLTKDQIDTGYFLGPISDIAVLLDRNAAGLGADDFALRELTRFRYRVLAPSGWQRRLRGLDWAGLARLPWIGTPQESVHHRLLARIFTPLGVLQNCVTQAGQEASMLELVRAGVGLCLSRESVALHERQTNGLVIADDLGIETSLSFATLRGKLGDPRIVLALEAIDRVWKDAADRRQL